MWKKISQYFSTSLLTDALLTALAGSAFLYLCEAGLEYRWLNTLAALIFYWRLLGSNRRHWFWSGFFLALFWFWWLGVSFIHYGFAWALPLLDLTVALLYGLLLWLLAYLAHILSKWLELVSVRGFIIESMLKATALLSLSYIHPFGFDWFKAELPLVISYFGVDKVSFASLLFALIIARLSWGYYRQNRYLKSAVSSFAAALFLLGAIQSDRVKMLSQDPNKRIILASTQVPVEMKWRPQTLPTQINTVLKSIDSAIEANASLILLPESVLPIFLNQEPRLLKALQERSLKIDIVLGALYRNKRGENRNSAYLFHKGSYQVANKVVLVPFGEANPLPSWASRWINKIFFDGAPDYTPAARSTDMIIGKVRYRIGICYEGSSEALYRDNPSHLLLISNNGWFYPSIEPTLQRILLEYYVRKYGTTIYNSVNMAPSYLLRPQHSL